ncbi:uncharacterized protein Dmoj_GI16776 [Drosophila mojavensis]|uniref:Uncharacterized protein n=1 Tax=Drosophila mojavensis TaxID=7230 RepID=B4L940_DROMO|nr:uncharacterized protein Dmoj_GI16776 [Drosophila mojavensis]
MGYDNYNNGTEVAESGQAIYAGGNGNNVVADEQFAVAAAELQPSLNRVLSSIDYDLCFKHPLEHTWTLWHWENDRTKSWSDMLSDVTSFNTVEDFFSVYYFIRPPSDLKVFTDYMVFKHGIRCSCSSVRQSVGPSGRQAAIWELVVPYPVQSISYNCL